MTSAQSEHARCVQKLHDTLEACCNRKGSLPQSSLNTMEGALRGVTMPVPGALLARVAVRLREHDDSMNGRQVP